MAQMHYRQTLHQLYTAVAEKDEAAIAAAPARLKRLRTEVQAQGSDLDRSLFDRYFQLIALHVPGLDQNLGLDDAQRATADRVVQDHTHQARSVAGLRIAPQGGPAGPALRIAVSGIGRSGTTLIYQQLAKLLLLDDRKTNFRYEPYLWNIRSAQASGNPFDMSQLHPFGLMVHTTAPLFLDGPDPIHDPFIDHLFNQPWDHDRSRAPDAYLTKVIRGSGRLRSYLTRYPDVKIVACLRNPVDTINSSLGMFSFFGEEFHADDRPRFRRELHARGGAVEPLGRARRGIEWYAAWWHAFTKETLATAAAFPDQVFLFCYESFQQDPAAVLDSLMDFVGIRNVGIRMGLEKPAGPTIRATSLTQHDMHALGEVIDYYNDTVLAPRLGTEASSARMDRVVSRYLGGRFPSRSRAVTLAVARPFNFAR